MIEQELYLHVKTGKAVLVSPSPLYCEADRLGAWLPLSQITILEQSVIENPRFGDHPAVAFILGVAIRFTAAVELLNEKGLTANMEPVA